MNVSPNTLLNSFGTISTALLGRFVPSEVFAVSFRPENAASVCIHASTTCDRNRLHRDVLQHLQKILPDSTVYVEYIETVDQAALLEWKVFLAKASE